MGFNNVYNNPLNPKLYIVHHECNMLLLLLLLLAIGEQNVNLYSSMDVVIFYT